MNCSHLCCVSIVCQLSMSNALFFTNFYVDNKFVTFVNSCSHLNSVEWANISCLNVSAISNKENLTVSTINTSLIANLSCINSGINQNGTIFSNQLNLSLKNNKKYVCFY